MEADAYDLPRLGPDTGFCVLFSIGRRPGDVYCMSFELLNEKAVEVTVRTARMRGPSRRVDVPDVLPNGTPATVRSDERPARTAGVLRRRGGVCRGGR
jgi:hypothetical protein